MHPQLAQLPPSPYVREFTAGEIIRNGYTIYGQNFALLFALGFLPALVSTSVKLTAYGPIEELALGFLLDSALGFVVASVITVAVSDLCVGNRPTISRSYAQFWDVVGKALTAYLLALVIFCAGLVMLVVPGIIFLNWFLFTFVVVMLERLGGIAALKRSKALGKGMYGRNFGVLLILMIAYLVPHLIAGGLLGMAESMNYLSKSQLGPVTAVTLGILTAVLYPPLMISFVLMYYDMRVRKESYDTRMLTEDLSH